MFVRKVPVEEGVSKSDGEEEIHKETCRVKKRERGRENETQTETRGKKLLVLTYGYSLCYDRCLNS